MPRSEPPAEWYRTCSQLPFNLFIDVIEEQHIRALVISGEPSDNQLYEAWAGIYYEYIDLNAGNEQIYVGLLKKEIAILNWIIQTTEQSIYLYSFNPKQELVAIILENGFDFTHRPDDPQVNINEAASISNQLAPMKMRVKMKEQELNDYIDSKATDNVDGKYFNKMIFRLSQHIYPVRAKDITVKEFVEMLHFYLDDIKTKKEVLEDAN